MTLSSWVDDLIGSRKGELNTFPIGEFIPYRDIGGWMVKPIEIKESVVVCEYYSPVERILQETHEINFDGVRPTRSVYNIVWEVEIEHQA